MSQLKGEIGEKTSWDSKYCNELFHRRYRAHPSLKT